MLPKKSRLTKKVEFQSVLKKGKKLHGQFLMLSVAPDFVEETKAGLVVSNKVSKKAVERNKIRRVLREVLKEVLPTLKKGTQLIFLAKPSAGRAQMDDLKKESRWLLRKLK